MRNFLPLTCIVWGLGSHIAARHVHAGWNVVCTRIIKHFVPVFRQRGEGCRTCMRSRSCGVGISVVEVSDYLGIRLSGLGLCSLVKA